MKRQVILYSRCIWIVMSVEIRRISIESNIKDCVVPFFFIQQDDAPLSQILKLPSEPLHSRGDDWFSLISSKNWISFALTNVALSIAELLNESRSIIGAEIFSSPCHSLHTFPYLNQVENLLSYRKTKMLHREPFLAIAMPMPIGSLLESIYTGKHIY